MASDNVDLRFLGEKMQQVQSDLRQVRADQLRQEGEQVQMQDRLARVESKIDAIEVRFGGLEGKVDTLETTVERGFAAMDARFEQVFQTIATNTRILLDAIRGKLGS